MTTQEAIEVLKNDIEICTIQQEQACDMAIKALEQKPSREWKEIYAESEGSNSWIEFKCPHCGYSFGMESGEYDWHYGDEIPWKYCPICGGSAEHKPYKAESEE